MSREQGLAASGESGRMEERAIKSEPRGYGVELLPLHPAHGTLVVVYLSESNLDNLSQTCPGACLLGNSRSC